MALIPAKGGIIELQEFDPVLLYASPYQIVGGRLNFLLGLLQLVTGIVPGSNKIFQI